MEQARSLRHPLPLRMVSAAGLGIWALVAAFPLFWVAAMSFKLPLDAFSPDPWQVILGFDTRRVVGGATWIDLAALACAGALLVWSARRLGPALRAWGGWLAAVAVIAAGAAVLCILAFMAARVLDAAFGAEPALGLTTENYRAVWVGRAFYRQFFNSMFITAGVVVVSLSLGTLAGYGLARTRTGLAFWLLMIALIFRAMPHSVLVAGYLPAFINSREILAPLWANGITGPVLQLLSVEAPTLYGQPLAVIAVLVAINQPFTIWMLRSFFANIPPELDEAARVDGCSHFEAFRRVIIPVMWPGVITTGLFSFLLAYNDYLVTALLLDAQSLTMVPAISQFLNSENSAADQLLAIAAAVSITAPLFLLIMVFQRNIVGGLTQGAVKG